MTGLLRSARNDSATASLTSFKFWCILYTEAKMDNQTQIIAKISDAKNILITVGHSPSVDVLTAALALTLAIDKMKKHSSAIFSGELPPIMKFLHPERTFEDSTESFRDFIISLDKDKADKLRYKVEGDLVKIFITPYHTTISPSDLKFEQGDLNVDLIIALGVKAQTDIDKAAMAHGKILHSAVVITVNAGSASDFGMINSVIPKTSGYSEAISKLIIGLDENLLSKQISTALLTGIVIESDQFSNARTTPDTMTVASKLLSNGADQQLIVKEIRGSGQPREELTEQVQEIPELENEPAEPPAPEPVEPIETLDDYLPPPLPDFTDKLPPPPDITAEEFSETLPPIQTKADEPQAPRAAAPNDDDSLPPPPDTTYTPTPTPPEPPSIPTPEPPKTVEIVDATKSDPTQFHIPV
jgi:hypothetical protein